MRTVPFTAVGRVDRAIADRLARPLAGRRTLTEVLSWAREQAPPRAPVLYPAARLSGAAWPRPRDFSDISHYTVEVNRLENDGDRVTREAMASLFDDGIDPMVVIRWKDIYERLENAIDSTERVANILEGIIIKNR